MINNDILEEIIATSLKERYLTKLQIQKIVTNRIDSLDYISKSKYNGLIFGKEEYWEDWALATFNVETGIITVNTKHIKNYQNNNLQRYSILTQNLETLTIVLHEIEHLREKYKSTKNNIEGNILKFNESKALRNLCIEKCRKKDKLIKIRQSEIDNMTFDCYNAMYNINPFERIAEISASKLVLDSIKNYPKFKENYFGSFNYINRMYMDDLCRGYKIYRNDYSNFILCDYFNYLKSLNYLKKIIRFNFNSNDLSNLENKMKLGFRITSDEYNKIQNEKKIIVKAK